MTTLGSPSTLTNLLKQQSARIQTAQSLGISPPPRQPQSPGVTPLTQATSIQIPAQPAQPASVAPAYSQQMFDATKEFLKRISLSPTQQSFNSGQGY